MPGLPTYLLLLCRGVITVPGGAGGFLLGGIIIKRWSLTVNQQLRGMFVLGMLGVCSMLMFCVQCEAAPLADATLHQQQQLHDDSRCIPAQHTSHIIINIVCD